jgi:hypothetical protein
MRYELDRPAIQSIYHNPEGMVGRYMNRMGAKLRALAVMQAGMKTGRTKGTMFYRLATSGQGLILTVGSNGAAALWHHEGTKPHVILPKFGHALRFKIDGKIVYARVVHHPGTKPNRYLTDNLRRVL